MAQHGKSSYHDSVGKRYDRAYFDRWYRDPARRVVTMTEIRRRAFHLVATAERITERPVCRVLDLCCGEGSWRAPLRALRPRIRYIGVDASPYAVERFGRSRAIRLGTFGALAECVDEGDFDLVLCIDALQYIPDEELAPGLHAVAERLAGVACLEAFTSEDRLVGDKTHWQHRTPSTYRRFFRRAGLVPIGMHCLVPPALAQDLQVFERA